MPNYTVEVNQQDWLAVGELLGSRPDLHVVVGHGCAIIADKLGGVLFTYAWNGPQARPTRSQSDAWNGHGR